MPNKQKKFKSQNQFCRPYRLLCTVVSAPYIAMMKLLCFSSQNLSVWEYSVSIYSGVSTLVLPRPNLIWVLIRIVLNFLKHFGGTCNILLVFNLNKNNFSLCPSFMKNNPTDFCPWSWDIKNIVKLDPWSGFP